MELTLQLESCDPPNRAQLHVVSRSDQGDRSENQDAIQYFTVGDWFVCALGDGAGGHQGGAVAAVHAVEGFTKLFKAAPTLDALGLIALVNQVNLSILEAQQSSVELEDMHSTLCVLVLNQRTRQAVWLHVGDSRVYRFHRDRLLSRTKDHSLLQWMADHPSTNAEKIQSTPTRNTLYTAMGEQPSELQVEVSPVYTVRSGDWFLLCSDGLWEHFNDTELGLMGTGLWNRDDCCTHIHQLALTRAAGRSDNVSSVILFIGEGCH